MTLQKNKLIVSALLILLFLLEYFYIKEINTIFITGYNDNVNYAIVYDAKFYYLFVNNYGADAWKLYGITRNLYGPTFVSWVFDNDLFKIFIFYFISFVFSIYSLVHHLRDKKLLFFILLLYYPVMVGSLYGANKEITTYISLIFMLTYIISMEKKFLFMAFLFAIISRIELLVVYVLYMFISRFQRKYRIIFIMLLLFSMSVILAVTNIIDINRLNALIQASSSGGTSLIFANLDKMGLYFLTFPVKAILNMYSGVKAGFTLSQILTLFGFLSNIFFIILTLMAIKKKNLFIENNVFLLMLLYLILFSAGYFIHHRYVAPIYALWLYMAFFKQTKGTQQ